MTNVCKTDKCKTKSKKKKNEPTIYRDIRDCNLIIEVRDARLPVSSQVRFLHSKFESKQKVIFLTKCDLVSEEYTKSVVKFLNSKGFRVFPVCPTASPKKLTRIFDQLAKDFTPNKSLLKVLRVLIIGLPNVGKSTIINSLRGKKVTRVGNVPGVTKGRQWIKLSQNCYLMDTPGVATLAAQGKEEQRLKFGICRMISQKEYEFQELVAQILEFKRTLVMLRTFHEDLFEELGGSEEDLNRAIGVELQKNCLEEQNLYELLLKAFAKRFGYQLAGGQIDEERAAAKCFQWMEKKILPDLDLDHILN